jgi:FMN phosphatase YigB (HAD superfamily)
MARRPQFRPEKQFTEEQLAEIRRNFAMLSNSSRRHTRRRLERCGLGRHGRAPDAEHYTY